MRIAIAGSPSAAIPCLQAIAASQHDLVRVISQPDRPAGRGRTLVATPVSQWALEHSYELARPTGIDELRASCSDVDCVVTIGFGVLLPEELLSIPRFGFLNVHFSLLPRWRGAAPVQRAIEAGDALSGITIFKLDKGMDTGPFYAMSRFALDADITSDELLGELAELAPETLLEVLESIESGAKPTQQSEVGASRAFKLSRDEGHISWNESAEAISSKIRAFTSNPGAWILFRGLTVKITFHSISDLTIAPGELRSHNGRLVIGTASLALAIDTVIPSGKSAQPSGAWLNGVRLLEGERCE